MFGSAWGEPDIEDGWVEANVTSSLERHMWATPHTDTMTREKYSRYIVIEAKRTT